MVLNTRLEFTAQVYRGNINYVLKWVFTLMEITFAFHFLASRSSAVSLLLISWDGQTLTDPAQYCKVSESCQILLPV